MLFNLLNNNSILKSFDQCGTAVLANHEYGSCFLMAPRFDSWRYAPFFSRLFLLVSLRCTWWRLFWREYLALPDFVKLTRFAVALWVFILLLLLPI